MGGVDGGIVSNLRPYQPPSTVDLESSGPEEGVALVCGPKTPMPTPSPALSTPILIATVSIPDKSPSSTLAPNRATSPRSEIYGKSGVSG